MLRLITDENVPSSVSRWLAKQGHDTQSTSESLHNGATDSAIIKYAHDQDRIIVTLDQDFIRLFRQSRIRFGTVVMRVHPRTPSAVLECLERLFNSVDVSQHRDSLIILTAAEIRIETR